ncbi:MAG: serine hydrolase domain-containing protein [Kordiimonas sp.]
MRKTIIAIGCWFLLLSTANATDVKLLEQANEQIENQTYASIDSMLVSKSGSVVSEHYYGRFDANTLHRTHSSFKSIAGLLTLIAIDQKLLRTDEPILPLLALLTPETNEDPRQTRITVGHLLDMTSGLDCDEAPQSQGPSHEEGVDEGQTPLIYSLGIDMAHEPGSEWHYCSANSFMLTATVSGALKRANRGNIFEFADENLFAPLGITNYRLTRSANGKLLNGQGNSYFRPKDLLKIGQLLLNRGRWNEKQIISGKNIARLFNAKETINWSWTDTIDEHPKTTSLYSSQWYQTTFIVNDIEVPITHSWGNGGQFIFVAPTLELAAVFTGSNQGSYRINLQKQPFDIMYRYVLPAIIATK